MRNKYVPRLAADHGSLSALYLAETNLQFIDASLSVRGARERLDSNGFDAAPLAEEKPRRYFSLDQEADRDQQVSDVAPRLRMMWRPSCLTPLAATCPPEATPDRRPRLRSA